MKRLNIQFVNQFFWPDSAATGQFVGDVAASVRRSDSVTVICGASEYATTGGSEPPDFVVIRRVRVGAGGHFRTRKVCSYLSFILGAFREVCFGPRADVTITLTTPPLLCVLGWIAQIRGARHIIWEMDLYPDVAVELGVFENGGLAENTTGWVTDFVRRRADAIIALGPCMEERLRRRSIGCVPIYVVQNWADGAMIMPQEFRRDGLLKVFYSGNMGLGHDFGTVVDAVNGLDGRFFFSFSGGGVQWNSVAFRLRNTGLCEFRGYHERHALNAIFGVHDVGLVTQRAETVGTIVPSKVYGILAAGRGVLYIGPPDSTVGRVISEYGVGWQVSNGDVVGLRELLFKLQANPEMVETVGRRAREVFLLHFDRIPQVEKILSIVYGNVRGT